jgi:hypothetical protein
VKKISASCDDTDEETEGDDQDRHLPNGTALGVAPVRYLGEREDERLAPHKVERTRASGGLLIRPETSRPTGRR